MIIFSVFLRSEAEFRPSESRRLQQQRLQMRESRPRVVKVQGQRRERAFGRVLLQVKTRDVCRTKTRGPDHVVADKKRNCARRPPTVDQH